MGGAGYPLNCKNEEMYLNKYIKELNRIMVQSLNEKEQVEYLNLIKIEDNQNEFCD